MKAPALNCAICHHTVPKFRRHLPFETAISKLKVLLRAKAEHTVGDLRNFGGGLIDQHIPDERANYFANGYEQMLSGCALALPKRSSYIFSRGTPPNSYSFLIR